MSSPYPTYNQPPERKLTRSMTDKMIAGVCGGIAQYLGVDATLVRLVFGVLVLAGILPGVLAYIVAWIVMPAEF
ncbi:PspC domain-containing protein [Corynebacterium bouchesdurhonense]|uniref:PspC domain-containing protein n=1 Tax=Corynebacterium bouchesdurhonense TaxID=1720192 RepID=UPI0008367705|nr:PspC domain-containing protein [Corynebacterium bouchesdurhonense]